MLKKIVSIALIFLLSGQCLYKLGMMAYFEINRDYIAEVLCINKNEPITVCYGKCYLEKKLNQVDEKTPLPSNKTKIEIPHFVVMSVHISLTAHDEIEIDPATLYLPLLGTQVDSRIFHPPLFG